MGMGLFLSLAAYNPTYFSQTKIFPGIVPKSNAEVSCESHGDDIDTATALPFCWASHHWLQGTARARSSSVYLTAKRWHYFRSGETEVWKWFVKVTSTGTVAGGHAFCFTLWLSAYLTRPVSTPAGWPGDLQLPGSAGMDEFPYQLFESAVFEDNRAKGHWGIRLQRERDSECREMSPNESTCSLHVSMWRGIFSSRLTLSPSYPKLVLIISLKVTLLQWTTGSHAEEQQRPVHTAPYTRTLSGEGCAP